MSEEQGLLNQVFDPTSRALRVTGLDGTYQPFPWVQFVSPLATAASNTGWSTIAQDNAYYFGGYRTNTPAQNEEVTFSVTLDAGTHTLDLWHNKNNDRGIYTIALAPVDDDGTVGAYTDVGTVDGYSDPGVAALASVTGIVVATAGRYRLRFKMATKNPSSSNYRGIISGIQIVRTGA